MGDEASTFNERVAPAQTRGVTPALYRGITEDGRELRAFVEPDGDLWRSYGPGWFGHFIARTPRAAALKVFSDASDGGVQPIAEILAPGEPTRAALIAERDEARAEVERLRTEVARRCRPHAVGHPGAVVMRPATDYDFDDLTRELEDRRLKGLIRAASAPDNDTLTLYCYTQNAVVSQAWDPVVMLARGLVLDHAARVVRAQPFPKFFNFGEQSAALPDEPFEVFEKLDGSLGVIFHDGRRWRVNTKGSFTAPQAQWAEARLSRCDLAALRPGHTYLAEIIYAANQIVVRYPFEDLVMLAAFTDRGVEYPRVAVEGVAEALGVRVCAREEFPSFDAMRAAVAGFDRDREGFVVRFASGYRVKVKGAAYLRAHRLASRVTPLALWEAMAAGDNLDAIRREIPEEFWPDFDAIRSALTTKHDRLVAAVDAEVARWRGASDKDVGLALSTVPGDVRTFLFAARRGGEAWARDPKLRTALHRPLRPTGNVLDGYTPTDRIARVQDAA